ncbi:hypothetical protein EDD16DRAFT_263201 [Pisolithus croceorrhizus]|nr:hypothetical protein EV401DRAFT_1157384 [Pisolithus croceorrhizus]KAI6104582.1 hypothetical protein EDD16DRAFT_263201 [Pisolithus croceorrhizus]KAI6139252.1 hypothetical protein EDD17DRAFT_1770620 [Pisolithus thermaeus]
MANKLACGQYRIIHVGKKEYLGVSNSGLDIYPPPPAPVVVLRPDVVPPEFTIVPVNVEANAYVILVEKRVTRDQEDRVFAIVNEPAEVWLIRYEEAQDAYSIQKRGEFGPDLSLGWTLLIFVDTSVQSVNPDQITLQSFSEPGPYQLFKFERVAVE